MSSRQRYYTPRISDAEFNKMIDSLSDKWAMINHSDIIHRAITEAYERTNERTKKK